MTDIDPAEASELQLDDFYFETKFLNVLDKGSDTNHRYIKDSYGVERILYNGYPPRTKHEIFSGLKCVENRGLVIDGLIYNLPFTVSKRGRPAETAFTDRDPERRAINLVSDHTATRIMKDSSYHLDGIHMLQSMKSISKELAE